MNGLKNLSLISRLALAFAVPLCALSAAALFGGAPSMLGLAAVALICAGVFAVRSAGSIAA